VDFAFRCRVRVHSQAFRMVGGMTLTEDLARAIEPFLRLAESDLVTTAWADHIDPEYAELRLCNEWKSRPIPVEDFVNLRRAWADMQRGGGNGQ
jgi:hypothetical protein